ncbi:FliH/SctL family protein [Pseudoxanthomonas taiwanensis]|jgi:Flagellar biosynthesis/type III secretory pathway protein|uniref:Flagellar assembly protein FliH n=1 Tax=Pseudoxanthomonas taiwanensis TaxID=176598 RepID=A0A921NZN1_9GAMM|nr:FliH/SctL family protein [Pseudoxanthomonas taiwanensis]KAF1688331.1 flagellar assembly protein FliH [Pseudoxanthomonas taiwanensis]MBO2467291.1 flagellar assembly protein FliH [Xanthomonadaceae bacterium]
MTQVVRWIAPELEVAPPPEPEPVVEAVEEVEVPRPPTLEEIQAIEEQARREGYEAGLEQGRQEGFAQGQAEVRRLIAQIEGILDNFTRPLARLENEVTAALGELAVRIAGSLIGRAYAADPVLLSDLVSEALDVVGGASRDVEVRLHPDDIAALAPLMAMVSGVRLVPDPALGRGDLRVHAETMRIDGTLEARLRGALESVIHKAGAGA